MKDARRAEVVRETFLRDVDARAKLIVALGASTAVMLPLPALVLFCAAFSVFLAYAGLVPRTATQLGRLLPVLVVLFALDATVVGASHAVLITLRLCLVATTFLVVQATTTAEELAVALERLGVPARVAFVFAASHRALGSIGEEVRGIVEAQRARGIGGVGRAGRFSLAARARRAVAYVVPAVVLVTERAWQLNEAAQVRGLESPHRTGPGSVRLCGRDRALMGIALAVPAALAWWS